MVQKYHFHAILYPNLSRFLVTTLNRTLTNPCDLTLVTEIKKNKENIIAKLYRKVEKKIIKHS